jgi:hypothetical protein
MPLKVKLKIICKNIKDLVIKGLIGPLNSYFASSFILVKKKSGETRVCMDYSHIYTLVKIDAQMLPVFDQLNINFLDGKYFIKINPNATYNKIK